MVLVHSSDVEIWLSVFTFPKKKWEVMKNHIFKKIPKFFLKIFPKNFGNFFSKIFLWYPNQDFWPLKKKFFLKKKIFFEKKILEEKKFEKENC